MGVVVGALDAALGLSVGAELGLLVGFLEGEGVGFGEGAGDEGEGVGRAHADSNQISASSLADAVSASACRRCEIEKGLSVDFRKFRCLDFLPQVLGFSTESVKGDADTIFRECCEKATGHVLECVGTIDRQNVT